MERLTLISQNDIMVKGQGQTKNLHTNFLDVCFEEMQEENILLILLKQKYFKHENNEVELTV